MLKKAVYPVTIFVIALMFIVVAFSAGRWTGVHYPSKHYCADVNAYSREIQTQVLHHMRYEERDLIGPAFYNVDDSHVIWVDTGMNWEGSNFVVGEYYDIYVTFHAHGWICDGSYNYMIPDTIQLAPVN